MIKLATSIRIGPFDNATLLCIPIYALVYSNLFTVKSRVLNRFAHPIYPPIRSCATLK